MVTPAYLNEMARYTRGRMTVSMGAVTVSAKRSDMIRSASRLEGDLRVPRYPRVPPFRSRHPWAPQD